MKKEDLKKLKFTTWRWANSSHKTDFVIGFMECKQQIIKLLEEEENENINRS